MTCRDLGGPCDTEITGDSFEEVGKKSYEHVMQRIGSGDEAHKAAAAKMRDASPEDQKAMMLEYERRFNAVPGA